ncbi:MAG: serine/threonine-protein kinase [Myxococcota bacterium]
MERASSSTLIDVFRLASGGMGTVAVAVRRGQSTSRGQGFQRLYAVKRIHPHLAEDREFRQMFLDEARIAGLIQHRNVVAVLDVGEDANGPYLLMEYVDGVAASELITSSGGVLPLEVAVEIIQQAAEGLHAAHELSDISGKPLNVVHRDVSPANVLVGFDGDVKVTDFGIAKALGRRTKTSTGVLKGKFGYMCPEQLRYQPVDRRGDIFSLGVVLYELLTGVRLYENDEDNRGLRAILEEPPPDLGAMREDAPPELVDLLMRMLAKDPAHRPGTGAEVARRLRLVRGTLEAEVGAEVDLPGFLSEMYGSLRQARRQSIAHALETNETTFRLRRPPRRRARVAVGVGVVALVGIGIGVGMTIGSSGTPASVETSAEVLRPVAPEERREPAPPVRGAAPPRVEPETELPEEPPSRRAHRPRHTMAAVMSSPMMSSRAMSTTARSTMSSSSSSATSQPMRGVDVVGWGER